MNEMLVEYLRYTRWATRTALDACAVIDDEDLRRDVHASHRSIWGTLVHIYQSDCVWWNRLQGDGAVRAGAFEPGSSIEDLRERWMPVLDELVKWAERLSDADWAQDLEYLTSRGVAIRQPVWEVALHVVNHATLHRGQILILFRQLDRVPTGVDLILYFREKSKAKADLAKP
ncbi:MAG: DinB family protein [Bryobacterales bacterium]|nr:DinB family protein [Bryobacterales bacterium]